MISVNLASLLTLLALAGTGAVAGAEPSAPEKPATLNRSTSAAEKELFQALREGNLPLLNAAIAGGASVNCRGTNGLPPLLALLRSAAAPLDSARRQCVAGLLAHGADVDAADSDRRSAVIHATRLGDLETLRLLVEAEAYVRVRDRFHRTALFYAVEADRRDLVVYLANNGALISISVKERKRLGQR